MREGRGGTVRDKGFLLPPPPPELAPSSYSYAHYNKIKNYCKYMYMVTERGGGGTKGFLYPPPSKINGGTLTLNYKLLQIHVYGNFAISVSKFEK